MPLVIDNREVGAVLEALRAISAYIGKESEYRRFMEWINWAEMSELKPTLDDIEEHTPYFIRTLSSPLRRLYGDGYNNGFEDAGIVWRSSNNLSSS